MSASSTPSQPNWPTIRDRARRFPETAFQFVRDGLGHTVRIVHGVTAESGELGSNATASKARHISGQQLCEGLRRFATDRYGKLAGAVMRRWNVRSTEDFGVIVYAMIDRGEMRGSDSDRFDDFKDAFDFEEAFGSVHQPR